MVSLLESICMESHLKQIAGESICGMKSLAGNDLIIIDTVFFFSNYYFLYVNNN